MKRKPIGWPDYMLAKLSKSVVRYYWNAPSWARKRGCPIKSEALGADYGAAKARCDTFLNPLFDSWRTGGASDANIHSEPLWARSIGQSLATRRLINTPRDPHERAPAMTAPSPLLQTIG